MRNAYVEVLRTYWLRAVSSWMTGIFVASAAIFVMLVPLAGKVSLDAMITLSVFGTGGVSFELWSHFSEQVIHENQSLTPHFERSHLIVFITLSAVMVLGFPLSALLTGAPRTIGFLALPLAIFAFLGWVAATMSAWLTLLSVLAYVLALNGWFNDFLHALLAGDHERIALGILIAAMGMIGDALRRLTRPLEAKITRQTLQGYNVWNLRPKITGEDNQVWAQREGHGLSRWMRPKFTLVVATGGLWCGARRWLSLFPSSLKSFVMVSVAMMVGASFPLFVSGASSMSGLFIFYPLLMVWALLPMLVGGQWLRSWQFLEIESLRPIERDIFFKEIGLAILIHLAQAGTVLTMLTLAFLYEFSARLLGPRLVATLVVDLIGIQVLAYGLIVSFIRFRALSIMFLGGVILFPIAACMGALTEDHQNFALGAAIVCAAIGLILTRDAYRRWLNTELG